MGLLKQATSFIPLYQDQSVPLMGKQIPMSHMKIVSKVRPQLLVGELGSKVRKFHLK
jgi:hypothetical protein